MHTIRSIQSLAFAAALLATPALAANEGKLDGNFYLRKSGCSAAKPGDCAITLQVSGVAAKVLYENMAGKAVNDACTGGQSKSDASGLRCYKAPDGYSCDFGYNFKARKMSDSDVSC